MSKKQNSYEIEKMLKAQVADSKKKKNKKKKGGKKTDPNIRKYKSVDLTMLRAGFAYREAGLTDSFQIPYYNTVRDAGTGQAIKASFVYMDGLLETKKIDHLQYRYTVTSITDLEWVEKHFKVVHKEIVKGVVPPFGMPYAEDGYRNNSILGYDITIVIKNKDIYDFITRINNRRYFDARTKKGDSKIDALIRIIGRSNSLFIKKESIELFNKNDSSIAIVDTSL